MKRVLIVEDEPTIRRVLELLFSGMGCDTMPAPDAETAESILEQRPPDLVIADIKLPGKDGVELTHDIRANPRVHDVPVILTSAYGEPRHHEADAFVPKPFDIDTIVDTVRRFGRVGSARN
jgi:CheY-like chemotaxis protein